MSCELDHLFILTEPGAPAAELLVKLGLVEGLPNRHPGQGTSNRRFFFQNVMLELLWVHDEAEARTEPARRTQLCERWKGRNHGLCPFGVALRPAGVPEAAPPFRAWEYRPPYLPGNTCIHLAEDNPLDEPLWFYLPFPRQTADRPAPLQHPAGMRELTTLELVLPGNGELSPAAQMLQTAGLLKIQRGAGHHLRLIFDQGSQGQHADLHPRLPLCLRW